MSQPGRGSGKRREKRSDKKDSRNCPNFFFNLFNQKKRKKEKKKASVAITRYLVAKHEIATCSLYATLFAIATVAVAIDNYRL